MKSPCMRLMVTLLSILTQSGVSQVLVQPEQVHLSYGADPSEMIVTWSTRDLTDSLVEYGINDLHLVAKGNATLFVDGGIEHHSQYIHRTKLTGLKPGTKYIYHCGSSLGWSDLFFFTAMKNGTNWMPRLAIYGDLGNKNAQSLARLQKEVQLGMYDAILHIGDFAYDMHDDNGDRGDAFMRQIEAVAAYVPYMTTPGNHEYMYNFSNYVNRFSMPGGDGRSQVYSFNMGPVHFVGFSTEFYFYFAEFGLGQAYRQYNWLVQDLKEANKPENRAVQPWIITMGHRPMYCTESDGDFCTFPDNKVRVGVPGLSLPGLEKLFLDNGVDIELWAHEHIYERLWPLYDYKVYNGSKDNPYRNPGAPVHITTGSAGCEEGHDGFKYPPPEWLAYRNSDYGYTRMMVHNTTHLYLEQVSDDKGGAIVDSVWVIKENHSRYTEETTYRYL